MVQEFALKAMAAAVEPQAPHDGDDTTPYVP
jgi:hypothetical protein